MTSQRVGEGTRRPVALIILDGWGSAEPGPGNAITTACTPFFDSLWNEYPHTLLQASGEAVGLPAGVMGNSEVGHLTLGTGRVNYQDLSRINHAIEDGSFFSNPVLGPAMAVAAAAGAGVHLMGLLSDGGVHSAMLHICALVDLAKACGVTRLYIHAFTDGRDTSPTSGEGYLEVLDAHLKEAGLGKIVTIAGRYYAMDRDKHWDRVKLAYDALVRGEALRAESASEGIRRSYEEGMTDEFVLPRVVSNDAGARISDGDTVIFFNFRADRTRELTRAFIESDFSGFDRQGPPPNVRYLGMTLYDASFGIPVAFPDIPPRAPLSRVVSEAGLTQLRIAETEKYAHVTFFFNGGREKPFPGETQVLVPSPRDIETYEQKPQMSAYEVAERFRAILEEEPPHFTVLNFANADMVGHTGDMEAAVQAVEHVDRCLETVVGSLLGRDARVVVTSDHGNAEQMLSAEGGPHTAHTTNAVPLILLEQGVTLRQGAGLADIAPTVLRLLSLAVPAEMTGSPLL
jgi:2,3-bisphosphoglycerate-independent phosphoglycerate mutase